MFNWTTTTIINSDKDMTTGLPLFKAITDGTIKVFKVKRDLTFAANYISKVYRKEAEEATLCEMTIDTDALLTAVGETPAHVRLSFYVSLEGSEESIYANDWYQKGKPFSIGFEVTAADTKLTIAKKIKKNAEKFGVVTYGKKIFEIVDNGDGTLTLKGTHEYQRFKMAAVAVDQDIDEKIVAYYEDHDDSEAAGVFTLVNRGSNGFGTFHQLVKDIQLPTAHNWKPLRLKADEKPEVGALYNQYILTYCAPSMANPGFTVIGQTNMSTTTHVFWVHEDVDDEFKACLEVVTGAFVADGQGVADVAVNVATSAEIAEDADAKSFGSARSLTTKEPNTAKGAKTAKAGTIDLTPSVD